MRVKKYYYIPALRRILTMREFKRLLKDSENSVTLKLFSDPSSYEIIVACSLSDAESIVVLRKLPCFFRTGTGWW